MAAYRSLFSGLVLSAVVLTGLSVTASTAQTLSVAEPKPIEAFDISAGNLLQPSQTEDSDLQSLTLPIVSEEMSQLASDLTKNFADNPQFASAEVPPSRDRVIVHWHGKRSAELSRVLSGHASVPVEVRQSKFRPGTLRQRATQLSKSDANMKSFSVNHDGSGIRISVSNEVRERKSVKAIVRLYEEALQAPVELADASPEPAADYTRQFDRYWHLGDARIHSWTDGHYRCTSGFSVRQEGTGKEGTMFAAHCVHPNSTEWAAWEDGDPYYYAWGNVAATAYGRDGAIIDSGISYPFIWTSTWNSDVYTQINGDTYPYVGQELCYSGSFSGIQCGNIVKNTGETYQFSGYPKQISAFRTQQSNSEPAAGNGDSGGPGYQLVNTTSGVKRLAVGIISAIPGDAGTKCQGVPGAAGEYGRKCSPTVWSGSVSRIGQATGWHVPEQ